MRARIAVLAALAALGACAPPAGTPLIADPYRVVAHCNPREARITSVRSVLTSTDDKRLDDAPSEAEVRAAVDAGDGAIAYWHDQKLKLPLVAASFGEPDGYVRVRAAGIPSAPVGSTFRHIYLDLRTRGGSYRWITMEAFDVQNVCVEGHKQS